MASMRRVRRRFRDEALRIIKAGEGNSESLIVLAGKHFGHDVGYETLIRAFLASEVSNAVSQLRNDGHVESIGKKWIALADLQSEDVDIIITRRQKRVRGELKELVRFNHEHGRTEDAITAAMALTAIERQLNEQSKSEEFAIEHSDT